MSVEGTPLKPVWLLLCIVVWVGAFFAPVATLQAINIQDDIFTSDLLNDRLPARAFVGESLCRGELPLWSPGIYTGFPMLAQVEVGAFYPSNALLFGLFSPYVAIAYAQLLPLVLIGAGTGLLALAYGLPLAAAALAGGTISVSGFFVTHIRQLNLIDAACWLPFLLVATERGVIGRRMLVAFAIPLALSLFAGHPQMSYVTGLGIGVYALFRLRAIDRALGVGFLSWLRRLASDRRVWRLASAVALGASIAAAQLVPSFELAALGHRRGGLPYEMAAAYPVSPSHFLTFLDPYAHGDASERTFSGSGIFWEQYGYLGLVPMLLAGFAVIAERRDTRVRLWFGIAIFAYAMVLGPNTPVFPLAFQLVPGMSYFRFPARFLLLVEMAIAILAAIGFARLLGSAGSKATSFVLVTIVLGGTAADLWHHQRRQVPLVDWETWTQPVETAEIIRTHAASSSLPPRVFSLDSRHLHAQIHHLSKGWAGDLSDYVAFREYLQPSSNLLFGLESVDGYANLVPSVWESIWASDKASGLVVPSGGLEGGWWRLAPHVIPLLELFGVRYVISAWTVPSSSFERVASTREGIQIYELPGALPRAFVVGRVRPVSDDREGLEVLRSASLASDEEAIVEAGRVRLPPDARSSRAVHITARSPTNLVIDADLSHPGLLVVSESYYPGWRAWVDGEEVAIHRANLMMRAVELPAGRHEVRFEFRPASVRLGMAISAVALTILGLVVARERRVRAAEKRLA